MRVDAGGGEEEGRTFNCGVVFINEVTLDELYCQARLAHTTSTYHHQLVLSKELRRGSKWLAICASTP